MIKKKNSQSWRPGSFPGCFQKVSPYSAGYCPRGLVCPSGLFSSILIYLSTNNNSRLCIYSGRHCKSSANPSPPLPPPPPPRHPPWSRHLSPPSALPPATRLHRHPLLVAAYRCHAAIPPHGTERDQRQITATGNRRQETEIREPGQGGEKQNKNVEIRKRGENRTGPATGQSAKGRKKRPKSASLYPTFSPPPPARLLPRARDAPLGPSPALHTQRTPPKRTQARASSVGHAVA